MINVYFVVCFCLMFPQTKYEYDHYCKGKMTLYFIYPFILPHYRMFSIPLKMYTVSLIYFERGLYLENKLLSLCHVTIINVGNMPYNAHKMTYIIRVAVTLKEP